MGIAMVPEVILEKLEPMMLTHPLKQFTLTVYSASGAHNEKKHIKNNMFFLTTMYVLTFSHLIIEATGGDNDAHASLL